MADNIPDVVQVDEDRFVWICPNCERKNYASPTIFDTPFSEVTCRNCGSQFGVQEPAGKQSI